MQTVINPNNKRLYVWHQGYVKKTGVPPSVEVLIKDSPSENPGKWTLYIPRYHEYPPVDEYAFPKELYLEVPAIYKVFFDFLGWNFGVKIVSEPMLRFLKKNGLTDGYELAIIKDVINRKGKVLTTNKKYFALRFNLFDDALLDFRNKEEVESGVHTKMMYDIFPNMCVRENVDKRIFVLEHFTFRYSLLFTEDIKAQIEENKFVGPEIYAIDEFYKAFNERPRIDTNSIK